MCFYAFKHGPLSYNRAPNQSITTKTDTVVEAPQSRHCIVPILTPYFALEVIQPQLFTVYYTLKQTN